MKKKVITNAVIVCVALFLLAFASVQFPQLYIKKTHSYQQFDIYSNSKIQENTFVKNTLDSVLLNLKRSEFYSPDQKFKLFFVKATSYSKVIEFLGMKNMASSKFDSHIYNAEPDFKSGWLIKGYGDLEKLNLVQVITHECVHSQMYPEYSTLGFMKTQSWINEGYSEYISYAPKRKEQHQSILDLMVSIENSNGVWLKTTYGNYSPRFYLKSRLIVEYLIEVKKMTVKDIINDTSLSPEVVYEDIKKWYNVQEPF